MDERFRKVTDTATRFHGVVDRVALVAGGIPERTVRRWVADGRLVRLGPRSLTPAGTPPSWRRDLAAAYVDVGGHGFVAGRSAARLHRIDGFAPARPELLLPADRRTWASVEARVATTGRPIERRDVMEVEGMRCLRPERLVLDAPLFRFGRDELEHLVDVAVRRRLVSADRLRARAADRHTPAVPGGRLLIEALADAGVESHLERRFLTLVRRARLPEPQVQVVHRQGTEVIARVDFLFPPDLVVEVAGHGPHASPSALRRDAERRTRLTIAGRRVIEFSYAQIDEEPTVVASQVAAALERRAGAA